MADFIEIDDHEVALSYNEQYRHFTFTLPGPGNHQVDITFDEGTALAIASFIHENVQRN